MNNKQAYVYTFTPNGGIKEYHRTRNTYDGSLSVSYETEEIRILERSK